MIQLKTTIVIPCRNEGMGIIKCLELIELQSVKCDVIIADSSDRGYHTEVLRMWCRGKDWITIIKGGLPSVARNAGAALTDSEYILFLDADILLYDRDTILTALSYMEAKELITLRLRDSDGKWNWVWKAFQFIQSVLSKTHPFALGGFQLWRKSAFVAFGGFDEGIEVGEDWVLSKKVHPDKFCIIPLYAYTPGRRFNNGGLLKMVKLMIGGWINRDNPQWYYKSHNYWK